MSKDTVTPKKKAIAFAIPYEGRVAYLLAGLSHYYELTVYSEVLSWPRYRIFDHYFSPDTRFIESNDIAKVVDDLGEVELFVFQEESIRAYLQNREGRNQLFRILCNVRKKTKRLYYIEPGEQFFFNLWEPEILDLCDGVIKHHLFKPEYGHLLGEDVDKFLFHHRAINYSRELLSANEKILSDSLYQKLLPLPFPPSIAPRLAFECSLQNKFYDIAGNVQAHATARVKVQKLIEDSFPNVSYAFDYGAAGIAFGRRSYHNTLNPFLIKKFSIGKALHWLLYRRYVYPSASYVHNLVHSRVYVGTGLFFSSYRTADAWSHRSVLLSWDHSLIDYGIPLKDGYNYVSIGKREELFPDHQNWLDEAKKESVIQIVQQVLNDSSLQKQVIQGQLETYDKYFSHPKEFLKKLFPRLI